MTLTKTAIILFKKLKDQVLMSTAGPANLFGKIGIAQKQGLSIMNTLLWQWVKIGWKSRLQ
jgi:hypothetical protein